MENLQEKRDLGTPKMKKKALWHFKGYTSKQSWRRLKITGKSQMKWQSMPKRFCKEYVSDNELKDSITLNSPVPKNLQKAKNMDDYFAELLEDHRKKKEIAQDDTFKKLEWKILTIMGLISKVWYAVEESLAVGVDVDVEVDEMLQYIDQTILLIGQVFNSVYYNRHMNVLIGVETKKVKAKNTIKNQLFQRSLKNFLASHFAGIW